MSAPVKKCEVTPLEARCAICLDTGEVGQMGYLDCKACDVATRRAELESWAQDHCLAHVCSDDLWRIYQHALAAAPVVPVAAQPVVPDAIKNAFVTLTHNGGRYSIILKFNQNSDTCAVHDFLLRSGGKEYNYAAPSLEAQPAGEVERDAARYRWLCKTAFDSSMTQEQINKEVDASMAQGEKQ